jgi:transposase InsO family protein
MTQGKIERNHPSMKNILLLGNYYSPDELTDPIDLFIEYYNYHRYHEALNNLLHQLAFTMVGAARS